MTSVTQAKAKAMSKSEQIENDLTEMVAWLESEDLDTQLAAGLIEEVESLAGLILLDDFIVDSCLKDLGLKAAARQKFRNAYLKLKNSSSLQSAQTTPPTPASAAAMIPIAIDKESLEAVRGFCKHNKILGEAMELAVHARDELQRTRESLLAQIQNIAAKLVDDALQHLEEHITEIKDQQRMSGAGEAMCLDAMQITSLSQLDAREATIKETTESLFTQTKIKLLRTAPSVSVSESLTFADIEASTGPTCVLSVSAVAPAFETRTTAGYSCFSGALALTNNWVAHGVSHASPTWRKCVTKGSVTLSGMVKNGGWGDVALLPEGCRPNKQLIFNLSNNGASCRVDVCANGRVVWIAGSKAHAFVSLDGIRFSTKASQQPLALTNNWVPYGSSFATPSYTKSKAGMVTLTGLAKGGGWGDVALLPAGCRPSKQLLFNVNNHAASCRVDVLADGRVVWVSGNKAQHWIALDGISFSTEAAQHQLALTNNWVPYTGPYAMPSYTKSKAGMVTLTGLAKGGGWGDVALLPADCRPSKRLVFNVTSNGASCRVDVLADGRVVWVDGAQTDNWVSLDGIFFAKTV